MTVLELARQYYPWYWDKERLQVLVANVPQRLTPQEYKQITGEDYAPATPTESA